MKQRLSLDVDRTTAAYLTERAQGETNGDVSALIERVVRRTWLADEVRKASAWYKAHPGFAEDAEIERYAAGAA